MTPEKFATITHYRSNIGISIL